MDQEEAQFLGALKYWDTLTLWVIIMETGSII
jgi:hypothetical protein